MACGCGKGKMARPAAGTTVQPNQVTRQSTGAKVVTATASPYTRQQNVAPAHLQSNLQRRTV